MTNRLPVIIAAINEERYIGRALKGLDAATTDPYVITNGSTDRTAEIARRFGARVDELPDPGKLPAMQHGMRHLGDKALGPVLFMDADSFPLASKRWAPEMASHLTDTERPALVAGTIAFNEGNLVASALRTIKEVRRAGQIAAGDQPPIEAVYGVNMGLRLNDSDLLDEMVALPHVWPGEDRYLASKVAEWGGDVSVATGARARMVTSARYHTSLLRRIIKGKQAVTEEAHQGYTRRAAPAATHEFVNGELRQLDDK